MIIRPTFAITDARRKVCISADEVREKVAKTTAIFKRSECSLSDVMYISVERSIDTIIAIIACLQMEISFTFCKHSEKDFRENRKFQTTLVFDGRDVMRISYNDHKEQHIDRISYVIETSGTTGLKKQVAVPVDCIKRNICHFCSLFEISPCDSILFSTSLLFDPSIVELFMAFHVGCNLVMTPDEFRSEPHLLQKVIEEFRPSIAQFTPTVFEMLPSPETLLSSKSPLRILMLGGSHFPLNFVNSIRSSYNTTKVFNVYGVTEVSCWASIFEVEIGFNEVLIGMEVDGTSFEVDSDGELILGGPRQCYVNGRKTDKHRTKDRVERSEKGGLKLVGRIDRIVKHQGIRICLDNLGELALQEDSNIQSVHSIYFKNRHLVQFRVGRTTKATEDIGFVESFRVDKETVVMITVIHLKTLPVNSSGKVDENELQRIASDCLRRPQNSSCNVRKFLKRKLNIDLEEFLDASFVSVGVNSLLAAELSTYFNENQAEVMRQILNDTITIRKILEKFGKGSEEPLIGDTSDIVNVVDVVRKRQLKMKWAVDLYKCIDGNILIVHNNLIVCASHSGIIVAVDPSTGECFWRTDCGVRFECKPTLVRQQVVIGCKTVGLFFLCLESGRVLNTVRHEKEEGIGVRSRSSFDGEFIYCSTENGYLHVIHPENHQSIFHARIAENGGGTSVGPVIAPDGSIFATTTSGCVSKITKNPFCHIPFNHSFGPIFAEPLFLGESSFLITSVNGTITILDSDTGQKKDSIDLQNEHCFCAPLKIGDNLIVGTQSGKLIVLEISPKLNILRIFQIDSHEVSFVKTPKILDSNEQFVDLMMISKNGCLFVGRLNNLEKFQKMVAFPISNNEVFTSPEVISGERRILITAGRDDYLRAWDFDVNYFE